ncbi:LAMI_0B05578g1_1 [Lachancea mirantina]|uniref:LAMI_0B05578g1_1 n=1 Tax=Lachancea mirantina TaxID=1230905 RepID=A0A1G4IWS5_9SACH|nr:LAMI_0B05578g1_1 [Lachancea mirantina]
MDFKYQYSNQTLRPFYAGSGAVASLSEDGTVLACSVIDEINILTTSEPSEVLHRIENDDEQDITALKLTPNAKYLSFVSQAQLLKIFELSTGKIVRSIKLSSPVYVMDCDSTSTLLALGGTDGSVSVIDIENGYITHSLKGHGGTISGLKFHGALNSSDWRLASGDTNGVVKVWDLVRRQCSHTLQEHSAAVRGLDFRSVGEHLQLLSGGRDDVVNVHQIGSTKKAKLLKTIPVYQQVEACGFLPGHELIYTAGGGAIFQIVSLDTEVAVKKTAAPIEELFIIGVVPLKGSSEMVLVLSDQTLLTIDVHQAIESDSGEIAIARKIAGNHGTVADMRPVGPHFDKLALATNSPALRVIPNIINMEDHEEEPKRTDICIDVDIYEAHTDLLNSLDATEDGKWIATASKDATAILWRYHDSSKKFVQYAKFTGHAGSVTAIGLPNVVNKGWPDFVLTASSDLTVKKWIVPKPSTDNALHVIKVSEYTRKAHEKDINALSVSPNDSVFATGSYDKTCKIWNVDTGELQGTLSGHKRGLWDVSFCQFDKILATASGDKTIKIWSLDTMTVMKTLEGHTNAVQRCSFLNRNKQIVSTGADGLVKIWDCSAGDCIRTLDAHANRIWALSVLQDGELLVTADADGVINFWQDRSEEEKKENLEREKLKVEQEQSLQNFMSQGDWTNAFLLALTLDHPMRLYRVLKSCPPSSKAGVVFNQELDAAIGSLADDQLKLVIKRCRDWNTNFSTYGVAQKTIRCIFDHHNIAQLSEIPGVMQLINALVPYTERHYSRIDNLVEQTHVLDYFLTQMDNFV